MRHKIYIASGLKNYDRVLRLRDRLRGLGVTLTYDWAEVYRLHVEESKKNAVEEDLEVIAKTERQAVLDCEVFLMVTPGGRGTHFELGIAHSAGKPVIILYGDDELIAFHTLPGIERFHDEDEALNRLLEILGDENGRQGKDHSVRDHGD